LKLLPIPGCQAIVTEERHDVGGVRVWPRLCGATSIAVVRQDDGQERFVCTKHEPAEAESGPDWRLHRREVAAGPVSCACLGRASRRVQRPPDEDENRPKRVVSGATRARISASQRARWARERDAERGGIDAA
jgi:hypothetical protein